MDFSQAFFYIFIMDFFDSLYLSVFQHIKQRKPKLAVRWSGLYVSIVQIALSLVLAVFFIKFTQQMKLNVLDDTSLSFVSIGIVGFILFKNWMSYNGKKRAVLMSKRSKTHSILVLILIPISLFSLAFILSKAA